LKNTADASLQAVDESLPLVVECDAANVAVSAILNQQGAAHCFHVKIAKPT